MSRGKTERGEGKKREKTEGKDGSEGKEEGVRREGKTGEKCGLAVREGRKDKVKK